MRLSQVFVKRILSTWTSASSWPLLPIQPKNAFHTAAYAKSRGGFPACARGGPRVPMKKGRVRPYDHVRDPLNRNCPYG